VVATISRLLKIVGLFCKRALQKRLHSAKESCKFEEPTNRSHPHAKYLQISLLRISNKNKISKKGLLAKRFDVYNDLQFTIGICENYTHTHTHKHTQCHNVKRRLFQSSSFHKSEYDLQFTIEMYNDLQFCN